MYNTKSDLQKERTVERKDLSYCIDHPENTTENCESSRFGFVYFVCKKCGRHFGENTSTLKTKMTNLSTNKL